MYRVVKQTTRVGETEDATVAQYATYGAAVKACVLREINAVRESLVDAEGDAEDQAAVDAVFALAALATTVADDAPEGDKSCENLTTAMRVARLGLFYRGMYDGNSHLVHCPGAASGPVHCDGAAPRLRPKRTHDTLSADEVSIIREHRKAKLAQTA